MKPRVDFRLVVWMRVEVDVGIEALEPNPLMLNAAAMRGRGDHGVRRSTTNRTGSLQLAAAVGCEEAKVFSGHVETQVVLLVDVTIERDVGVPEADAHVVERPGGPREGQFAAATCRRAAQPSAEVTEVERHGTGGLEALGVDRQRKVQLAGKVGPEVTRIDPRQPP